MSRRRPRAKPPATPATTGAHRRREGVAGRLVHLGAAVAIVLAAYWLMADAFGREVWPRGESPAVKAFWFVSDPFAGFRLRGGDLPLLAESRSQEALASHLLEPRDGQLLPLFRLWTHGMATLAGDLARLPAVLAWSSFGVFAALMLLGGRVVAREVGHRGVGLAAMAGLGVTTVTQPTATVFSAGQGLWAVLWALIMIAALQRWRVVDGVFWLVLAALAGLAGAFSGGNGLAAGLGGAAYLLAEPRRCHHKAALVPLFAAGLAVVATLAVGASVSPDGWASGFSRAWNGLWQVPRAILEGLVVHNLGLDATLTPVQGLVLFAGLIALWGWSRESYRPTPLEACGVGLAIAAYAIAFFLGGDSIDFSPPGWRDAMPQLGAVLFAAGWWSSLHGGAVEPADRACDLATGACAPRPIPDVVRSGGRRAWLAALGLTAALLVLHGPRARRLFLDTVPPITEAERTRFPIPTLQRLRGIYLASEEAASQRRSLTRLDRIESVVRPLGVSADTLRRAFPPFMLPGWPAAVTDLDPLDLLDVPTGPSSTRSAAEISRLRAALGALMAPEPSTRPDWLPPDAVWPPPQRE